MALLSRHDSNFSTPIMSSGVQTQMFLYPLSFGASLKILNKIAPARISGKLHPLFSAFNKPREGRFWINIYSSSHFSFFLLSISTHALLLPHFVCFAFVLFCCHNFFFGGGGMLLFRQHTHCIHRHRTMPSASARSQTLFSTNTVKQQCLQQKS